MFLFCFVFGTFQCTTVKGWPGLTSRVKIAGHWFHGARNQLFIHISTTEHMYTAALTLRCVYGTTSVVVVVGLSYVQYYSRGHEFSERNRKCLTFFRVGDEFPYTCCYLPALVVGVGREKCRTTFSGRRRADQKNYFKVFSNDETRAGRTRKEFHHRIFKFFLFYFVFVVHTGCVRGEVGGKFEFCNSTVDKWNSII